MFWHGRSFAIRLYWFTNLFLFKSAMFCISLLYYNFYNGYLGDQIYDETLFIQFSISMSNIAIFAYLLRDQDVSFGYTGKEEKLNFHLADHYAFCRDKFIKKHFLHYWLWYAYGWLAPVALMIIPLYAYKNGIMENGKTDGNYTCGFVAFFCLIIIHHA